MMNEKKLGENLKEQHKVAIKKPQLLPAQLDQLLNEIISNVDITITNAKSDAEIIEDGYIKYDLSIYINRIENKTSLRKLLKKLNRYYKEKGFKTYEASSYLILDFKKRDYLGVLNIGMMTIIALVVYHTTSIPVYCIFPVFIFGLITVVIREKYKNRI